MTEELPAKVVEFIGAARVCRVGTSGPGGQPHVIPVCPVFDGQTLYIDIEHTYATARNLAANPRLAVLIDQYDEDWSKLKGVLLHCRVQEVHGREKDRAWEMIRAKYPQWKEIDWEPHLTLALHIERWFQWGVV